MRGAFKEPFVYLIQIWMHLNEKYISPSSVQKISKLNDRADPKFVSSRLPNSNLVWITWYICKESSNRTTFFIYMIQSWTYLNENYISPSPFRMVYHAVFCKLQIVVPNFYVPHAQKVCMYAFVGVKWALGAIWGNFSIFLSLAQDKRHKTLSL